MKFLILPSGPFSPETIAAEGGLLPSWLINELCSHTIEFICEIELTLFIKSLKSRFVSKQYYNRCIRKYICMYYIKCMYFYQILDMYQEYYLCLCPILKRVAISSNVLFLVSGTLRYVKTQKRARNMLNGRKV